MSTVSPPEALAPSSICNSTALVCLPSPDEEAFGVLEAEIVLRREHVRRLEAELAPLAAALDKFDWEYRARVGTLQRELRDLEVTIETIEQRTGRIHARLAADPDGMLGDLFTRDELNEIGEMFGIEIPASWFAAEEAEERLERERAWRFFEGTTWNDRAEEELLDRMRRDRKPVLPEDNRKELRRLYLSLARLCHPDLAEDDEDRTRRETLMLQINAAWQAQDLEGLRSLERDRGATLGWRALQSWGERVIWARRECGRLDAQIIALTERLRALRASDTFPLWFNSTLGNSVMTQRATGLRIDIASAHHRLDEAKEHFRQALRFYAAAH
jgi:hypothetical protein